MAQHRAAVVCKAGKTAVLPRFYIKEHGAGVRWQQRCGQRENRQRESLEKFITLRKARTVYLWR